jgi:hypothetical protein
LALISPTSGGRSVGIVCLRAKATEFSCFFRIFFCFYESVAFNIIVVTIIVDVLIVIVVFKRVKGKIVRALRHEEVWGSGCTDSRILDLGTS